jgi:hypothetical protein
MWVEKVLFRIMHPSREPEAAAAHLIGDATPLGFRRHMVRLDEGDGASGNDTSAALAPRRKSVPSGNAHGYQLVFSMHATETALGAS